MVVRRKHLAASFLIGVAALGMFVGHSGTPDLENALRGPSPAHWLGADVLGRDVGRRLVQAAALSLVGSVAAWGIALVVGIAVGSFAAYTQGTIAAQIVEEFIRVAYATPFLVVLVGLLGLLGPGILNAYLVVLLFAWAQPARHASIMVGRLRHATHVRSVLALGYQPAQVVRFVLFPEVLPAVVAAALAVLPEILALDVALSFFGLGAQPPRPTIGGLLVDGVTYASVAPWLLFFPLGTLSLICLAMRGLRS